jgi:hypothetical protein
MQVRRLVRLRRRLRLPRHLGRHPQHRAVGAAGEERHLAFDARQSSVSLGHTHGVGRNCHAILTRTILAQHLIDMAMQGERDLERLVDSALERLTGEPDGATN